MYVMYTSHVNDKSLSLKKLFALLIKYLKSLNLTVLIRKDWTLVGYRKALGQAFYSLLTETYA